MNNFDNSVQVGRLLELDDYMIILNFFKDNSGLCHVKFILLNALD